MDKREKFIRENLGKGMTLKVIADTGVMDGNIFTKEFKGQEEILPAIEFMNNHVVIDVEVEAKKKPLRITIYDDFMGLEMSGEFTSEQEAREFYALELGTFEEDIKITEIVEIEEA